MTANEADEEDEVDENMPSTSSHNYQPSSSHIKRLRKGCMLLKNSESHTTDDSIDDSDGSGITTLTSMTGAPPVVVIGQNTFSDNLATKRQQFRNYHRNKHVQHHTHARYKTNVTKEDHPHVASGLKLAQSQAMAVAGFLPADSSTEKQTQSENNTQKTRNVSSSKQNARKFHEFHSVGSESMAGTDTTSLDAATDAQSLHTISSLHRPVL